MDPLTMIALGNAGMSGVQAINSGIKGQKAQKQLNQQQGIADETYGQLRDTGMGVLDNVIANMGNPNQDWANQAASMYGQGFQAAVPQGFDFQNPQSLAEQMTRTAIDAGNRARVGGREQLAMQVQGAESGLNAQLAARGLSPNSGAAVSAITQNAMGANQAQAGLERSIMDATGQAAMQGAQLDTQNLLNLTNMSSNFTMGNNQIQAGLDQAANQYNLGAAQGMAGLQGMRDQSTAQMSQILAGIGGDMMSGGLGGMEAGLDRRSEAVSSAGSAKGSAMGNAQGFATDAAKSGFGSNKGSKPIPIPTITTSTAGMGSGGGVPR